MAKKIVLDTSEGFLVIMNPEQRKHAEALALPELTQLLRKRRGLDSLKNEASTGE